MAVGLFIKSEPILRPGMTYGKSFTESNWRPMEGEFGFLPSSPAPSRLALASSYRPAHLPAHGHLSHDAHRSIRKYVYPLLDILAGLPSVIYGVWACSSCLGFQNRRSLFVEFSWDTRFWRAASVLSVMIIPLLVSLFMEIFDNVSKDLREASLAGRHTMANHQASWCSEGTTGMIAAIVLALSRTLGETIAVLMGCGNPPSYRAAYLMPAIRYRRSSPTIMVKCFQFHFMTAP